MKKNDLKKKCEYLPCHKELETCVYCFCPIYPCKVEGLGKYTKKGIWDCSSCTLFHKKDFVIFYEGFFKPQMKKIIQLILEEDKEIDG